MSTKYIGKSGLLLLNSLNPKFRMSALNTSQSPEYIEFTWCDLHELYNMSHLIFPHRGKNIYWINESDQTSDKHNHVSAQQTHWVANQWLCLNWEANLTSGAVYRSVFNISSLKECSGFNASSITRLTKEKEKKTRPTFHSNALWMIHNE